MSFCNECLLVCFVCNRFDSVLTGNVMYTYYSEIPKLMNTLGMAAVTLNKDFTQGRTLNQDLY